LIIKTNITIGNKERDMDIIAKAVAEALAKKNIDVQGEYTKACRGSRLCGKNIPMGNPNKRNILHKGILHTDHTIEQPTTKED
tara:strand:+ start:891 stop:1139 length:249 start_codon:yes stop_codon:yes gene_type:complete